MKGFEEKLADLDIGLFEAIPSQTTDQDKKSLLACQLAVRELVGDYTYLEIGSYLGGSIQPYLHDDHCKKIYSIDKRPEFQPDERGVDYNYQNNSTARMLELLKEISPEGISKIETVDGDTREMGSPPVSEKMQLCFVDGEHTDEAVFSDFRFCLEALDANGAIVFHDAAIVYNGLVNCLDYLNQMGIPFKSYNLPSIVFVVEIGDFPMHTNPKLVELMTAGGESYLFSLQFNDQYRAFANKKPFLLYRKLLTKLRGANKFD